MRLIDADAAIDALCDYLVGKRCPDDGTLTCRLIENEVIDKLPSVQPERKTGRWITHLYKLGKDRYECDSCHKRCDTEYRYCPNCGAKMEGEKKE